MGQQAEIPINLDSKSFKITQENIKNPDRSDNLLQCKPLNFEIIRRHLNSLIYI